MPSTRYSTTDGVPWLREEIAAKNSVLMRATIIHFLIFKPRLKFHVGNAAFLLVKLWVIDLAGVGSV